MKNKIKIFFLILVPVLFGIACGNSKDEKQKQYEVYYLDKNENHIVSLPYETVTPKAEKEFLVKELLQQLSEQTEKIEYKPVIVDFTKEVLVRAAIVKTLTQVEGIELIKIQVDGRDLADSGGKPVGVMSADTFIDNTGEDMKKYEEVTLTLYFANSTGDQLIKVNRTMRYNTNISLEKLVVEQIVYGPVEQKGSSKVAFPTLNSGTKIIGVNIKDGICYVNLNNTFLTLNNNVTADVVIYSLVNSLTELPGVLKVQLAVDGETEVKLGEKTLSALFERNLDLIQVEETK